MASRKTKTVYLSQLDEVAIQWPGDIRELAGFLLRSGDAKAREMNAKNPGVKATCRPTVRGLARHFASLTDVPSSRVEQELESRGFNLGALVEFDEKVSCFMTRTTIRLLLFCQYLIFLNAVAGAEHRTAITLPKDDWLPIEHCLGIIRQCQMEDGMIRIKCAGDPVWTVPYVSNFAAMALLAANDLRPNSADVQRVERWLMWYANNQKADGTIDDQEGIVSAYKSNGRRDSTDSYAATFLMAASRYQQAIQDKPALVIDQAARKALLAIETVTQRDGLTIAKPDYPMKYLMDNIEVYGGLQEGALFLAARGYAAEAARARQMAERVAARLATYWSEKDRCFATALDLHGTFSGGLSTSYPHGLAQLFALAHLAPERVELWHEVQRRFKPGDDGMPVERWLIAATRCGDRAEKEKLRRATRESMLRFAAGDVYVDRPAISVLAIIDGTARFRDLR